MKSIFDPTFKYRRSIETDVRKTFARVRREKLASSGAAPAQRRPVKVLRLEQRKREAG
jgi:hypothetical protein